MSATFLFYEMKQNVDLGKTQITDKIRVSSAAVFYNEPVEYYQYETWIFSDAPEQPSRQFIHGTSGSMSTSLESKTKFIHEFISGELKMKYQPLLNSLASYKKTE